MVKIILGNIQSRIVGYLPSNVHDELDHVLSYRVAQAHYIPSVKKKKWDGVFRLYQKNRGQSFYSGLLSFVAKTLEKNNIEFEKIDSRVRPDMNLSHLTFSPSKEYEEREYQQFTIDRALARSRGLLKVATGGGKCLGLGTPILMFDGSVKPVENIVVGDEIMGPDSTPRKVLSKCEGYGPLYRVEQKNGYDFVCNDAHILCLQRTTSPNRKWRHNETIEKEITASDFYNGNKWLKHTYKGFKVGVEFKHKDVPLDPYWLGLWLGDGNKKDPAITTGDKEIISYLRDFSKNNNLHLREVLGRGCSTFHFVHNKNHKNSGSDLLKNTLLDKLRELSVYDNKHIPSAYKHNDRLTRLSLLAGLIDSDGSAKGQGSVEFYNKNLKLIDDVCYLARSLGFRVYKGKKKDRIKSDGYHGMSYRLIISGNISEIPIKIKRKQTGDKTKYSALRYGISLTPIGDGAYYGFEIDKDGRFLLGDFTVTHNTMMVSEIISRIKTSPFMFYVLTEDLMRQAHKTLSNVLNVPVGMIGGGKFDIQGINVCTIQTAVRAVNIGNNNFKINDYQFDEEDVWDKKNLDSEDRLITLKNLLSSVNGLYMDECHHTSARTVKDVLTASPHAFWRFGGSATPYREDGAEIMIQAMFGKKIVDVTASYLIDKGYLIQPYILFVPWSDNCDSYAWQSIYSSCVVKNDAFNSHVAQTAKHLIKNGMSTLILVQQYAQGDFIKSLLPGVEFVTSKMTSLKREQCIQDLRDKKVLCMIATTLADEGLDIPTLDAAILAGGGASATRVHQRIGRTLRIDKTYHFRDRSIIIYYDHSAKYLRRHAKKARNIIATEPRFNIVDSMGPDYVNQEIDNIMQPSYGSTTIFDV